MPTFTFKTSAIHNTEKKLKTLEYSFEAADISAATSHIEAVIIPEIEADHFPTTTSGALSSDKPEGYYDFHRKEWKIGEVPPEDRPVFLGYSQNQMKPAFDLVKNAEHWKNPIDAVVPKDTDLHLLHAAVAFYTGSHLETEEVEGGYRVTADGYFIAIGA